MVTKKTQHIFLVDDTTPFGQEINPFCLELLRQWLRDSGEGGAYQQKEACPLDRTIRACDQIVHAYMQNIDHLKWVRDENKSCSLVAVAKTEKQIQLANWYLDEGTGIVIFNPVSQPSMSGSPPLPHTCVKSIDGYRLIVQMPGCARSKVVIKKLPVGTKVQINGFMPEYKGDLFMERKLACYGDCSLTFPIPPGCTQNSVEWTIIPTMQEVKKHPDRWTGVLEIVFPFLGDEVIIEEDSEKEDEEDSEEEETEKDSKKKKIEVEKENEEDSKEKETEKDSKKKKEVEKEDEEDSKEKETAKDSKQKKKEAKKK